MNTTRQDSDLDDAWSGFPIDSRISEPTPAELDACADSVIAAIREAETVDRREIVAQWNRPEWADTTTCQSDGVLAHERYVDFGNGVTVTLSVDDWVSAAADGTVQVARVASDVIIDNGRTTWEIDLSAFAAGATPVCRMLFGHELQE